LYRNALVAPVMISAMPAWLKARSDDHPGDKARKLAGGNSTAAPPSLLFAAGETAQES
jgi:hypothetical protein